MYLKIKLNQDENEVKYNKYSFKERINNCNLFIKCSERPKRYTDKEDKWANGYSLGVKTVQEKTRFYELATTNVWLSDDVSKFL